MKAEKEPPSWGPGRNPQADDTASASMCCWKKPVSQGGGSRWGWRAAGADPGLRCHGKFLQGFKQGSDPAVNVGAPP